MNSITTVLTTNNMLYHLLDHYTPIKIHLALFEGFPHIGQCIITTN